MTAFESTLYAMFRAAEDAGHPFPQYAACEAAYETYTEAGCFTSEPFTKGWGAFTFRQRSKPLYRTIPVQVWVTQNGQKTSIIRNYMGFPDAITCFKFRMQQLKTMPQYYEALHANTGEEFVRTVSAEWKPSKAEADGKDVFEFTSGVYEFVQPRWSVERDRATKVLAIYEANKDVFTIGHQDAATAGEAVNDGTDTDNQ